MNKLRRTFYQLEYYDSYEAHVSVYELVLRHRKSFALISGQRVS